MMGVLPSVIVALLVCRVSAVTLKAVKEDYASTGNVAPGGDFAINENMTNNVEDGYEMVGSDMVVSTDVSKRLYGEDTIGKRGALNRNLGWLWLGTPPIVPYVISDDLKRSVANDAIKAAIAEIQAKSCIKFKEKEAQDIDYISFEDKGGCWSFVGRKQFAQVISLSIGFCTVKRIAVHEIMHALGFLHEQSRPDRDDYVVVFYGNMTEYGKRQFRKYSYDSVNSLGQVYDYNSVMHYQNKEFSRDFVKDTVQKIGDPTYKLGQYSNDGGLTDNDAKQLNLLYKCPSISASNSTTSPPTVAPNTQTSPATTSSNATSPATTSSNATTSPATTSSNATTSPATASTTSSPTTATTREPYCGIRCIIRRILRRIRRRVRKRWFGRRRRRTTSERRRRTWYGRRRRRRRRTRFGWMHKKDAKKDVMQDRTKEKDTKNIDKVLSELEEEDVHEKNADDDKTIAEEKERDDEDIKMEDDINKQLEHDEGREDEDDEMKEDGGNDNEIIEYNDNEDDNKSENDEDPTRKDDFEGSQLTSAEEDQIVKEVEKSVNNKLGI